MKVTSLTLPQRLSGLRVVFFGFFDGVNFEKKKYTLPSFSGSTFKNEAAG